MTIKEFAYSAQQHLQNKTGENFKRAHIYELLAASFGYNSFAALCVESIVIQGQQESNHVPQQHDLILNQRCIELGYQSATADLVFPEFPNFITERQITVVNLLKLISELRGESSSSYQDSHPDWDAIDEYDESFYSNQSDSLVAEDEEFSPALIAGLEAAAANDNAFAHYSLALIHSPEDDYDHEPVPDYWYNQEQNGRVLTGVEKEWADQYAQMIGNQEKYEFHLREAGRLGNEQALLDLADKFDDPTFFENAKNVTAHDPLKVAEIADKLGRIHDVYDWLSIAAESGDIESMRRLIEEFDQDNLQRSWAWLYLAQLLGTDLTQDDYHAIHENGSMYDDDVGGPIFVDGQEGIKLAPLSDDQDAVARQIAQALFEKME